MGKFYIATAIPYVNDRPHIGHAILHLYADALARYHRQLGDQVLFSAGTDEHGGKIAEKATELKQTPDQLSDQMSLKFVELLKQLNISNDRFIRTTDIGHVQRAQLIWQKLLPYIYKGTYVGWYCTGCETFYNDEVVKKNKGICPLHNRPYEKLQEENYFFKLSAFSKQITEAINTDAFKVLPEIRKNEILSILHQGLRDISISRPKDKISWGIAVPGDDNQVMYVWFEALMNYITVLGYPEHPDFKKFWPADIQVIGKDILRFHAAVWPAMLIGLGLPLPKVLYVHGFITSDGRKMSKSIGNVVDPIQLAKTYGVDAFRYYFLRFGPSVNDVDFSLELFEEAYNSHLADELGNAVSRVAAMVKQYQRGLIGDIPEPGHDIAQYQEAIEDCRFSKALDEIWEQVNGLNQYIEEAKPWEIVKTQDDKHLREVLAYMVASLLEIATLLLPFMPDTAAKIQAVFGSGMLKPLPGPLFPKKETAKPVAQ